MVAHTEYLGGQAERGVHWLMLTLGSQISGDSKPASRTVSYNVELNAVASCCVYALEEGETRWGSYKVPQEVFVVLIGSLLHSRRQVWYSSKRNQRFR